MKTKFKLMIALSAFLFASVYSTCWGQSIAGPSPICPNVPTNYTFGLGGIGSGCTYDSWYTSDFGVQLTGPANNVVTLNADGSGDNSVLLEYWKQCTTGTGQNQVIQTLKADDITIAVKVVEFPGLTASIGSFPCASSSATFTVTALSPSANYFIWSVSAGGTIVTPSNSNSVTISKAASCLQSITVTCTAKRSECNYYVGKTNSITISSPVTLPTYISGTASMCPSTASIFSVPEGPNSCWSYNWYFSPAAPGMSISNSSIADPVISVAPGTAEGTKNLICTFSACGRTVTLTRPIKVCGSVAAPTDIVASRLGTTCYWKFTATSGCYYQYQWQINSDPIFTSSTPVISLYEPGTYTVKCRVVNGCGTSAWRTENFNLAPWPAPCMWKTTPGTNDPAIADALEAPTVDFAIFPNPTNASQDLQVACSEELVGGSLEIYNIAGARILQQPVRETQFGFSIENLEQGLYFCRISNGKNLVVRKLVVSE